MGLNLLLTDFESDTLPTVSCTYIDTYIDVLPLSIIIYSEIDNPPDQHL